MLLEDITKEKLSFKNNHLDHHSGQDNYMLIGYLGDDAVGGIEYNVYDNQPSVEMIEVKVEYGRRGFGKQLLLKLQSMYPDQEINLGMLTTDGAKLVSTIKFETRPTEWAVQMDRLADVKREIDLHVANLDEWGEAKEKGEVTPELEAKKEKAWAVLNDLNDEEYELEQATYNKPREYKIMVG